MSVFDVLLTLFSFNFLNNFISQVTIGVVTNQILLKKTPSLPLSLPESYPLPKITTLTLVVKNLVWMIIVRHIVLSI